MSAPSLDLTIQPQTFEPNPAALTSAPSYTASTPGSDATPSLSILPMRACACGERTKTAYACPAIVMSSV